MNLKEIAKQTIAESEILVNRKKIKVEDIIFNYSNGVHINGFDMLNNDEDTFPVFTFEEDESKYFYGGFILKKMIDGMLNTLGGDFNELNKMLADEPLHIKLKTGKTKKGRDITEVEIV